MFGFLDIERSHERIAALRVNVRMLDMSNAEVVLSSRIPSPSDDGVPGFDPKDGVFVGRKNSGMVGRINFVRGALDRLNPSEQRHKHKSPTNAFSTSHHR